MAGGAKKELDGKEIARRAAAIFERRIKAELGAKPSEHFVAIDVVSGDYEVDPDELRASDRLFARHPKAQVWVRRVGSEFICRFGPRRGR